MIGNILDNTTEFYMIKYAFVEIFSSGGATLCKNPSDQTVRIEWSMNVTKLFIKSMTKNFKENQHKILMFELCGQTEKTNFYFLDMT